MGDTSRTAEGEDLLARIQALPWDVSGDDVLSRARAARPYQYWRIETRGTQVASGQTASGWDSVMVEQRTIDWVPVDGRRQQVSDRTQRTIRVLEGDLSLEEARRVFPALEETLAFPPIDHASWDSPTPQWLAELPRDPKALRDRLYADSEGRGNSPDGQAMGYVADVLRSGLVPADLRAALYEVLKSIPGVDVTAEETTVMGRPGVAIGRAEPATGGEHDEIIIDPDTSEFVGERHISPDGVVTETTIVRTLVDDIPSDVRSRAVEED